VSEGADEEEGAPPTKKRRKMPKPQTKKVPKNSKKTQLPPALPTSYEFINSDAQDDDAA